MARDDTGPYFGTSYPQITRQDVWNDVVRVRVEECKRDANLPHDVCVVVARPFSPRDARSIQLSPPHSLLGLISHRAMSLFTAPRQTPLDHASSRTREHVFFTMFLSLFQEGANSEFGILRFRMSVSFLDNGRDVACFLRYVGHRRQ